MPTCGGARQTQLLNPSLIGGLVCSPIFGRLTADRPAFPSLSTKHNFSS